MTFAELQQSFQRQESLDQCASYLTEHAQALRDLFYGSIDTPARSTQQEATTADLDAEQTLIDFLNSPCGDELRRGIDPPNPIVALLIYFISLCERAGLYHRIRQVSRILPSGPLRLRADAISQYKHINHASTDYIYRFENITAGLNAAWSGSPEPRKGQCEDMLVEYFCSAASPMGSIGNRNRNVLAEAIADTANRDRHAILHSPRLNSILTFTNDRLAEERVDANLRIAEAFYDEAALLLPVPLPPPDPPMCIVTGKSHAGHCPPGLHAARAEIRAKYPTEYANTGNFVGQPLGPNVYTEFNNITKCMRYFRQYMPLHMPQVEMAVRATLDGNYITRRRLNVIDIGGGPGTLYTVLASVLRSDPYSKFQFDITLVEPSLGFHEFLKIIAKHVTHPNISVREMCACTSDDLPTTHHKKDGDWYFIANAITPMVKAAGGDPDRAVSNLIHVITATRRKRATCVLTIAENTRSADFSSVVLALRNRGLPCSSADCICNGAWLKGCFYRVAYSSAQIPAPRLRYACIQIPKGELT